MPKRLRVSERAFALQKRSGFVISAAMGITCRGLPVFDAGLGENPMPPPESMVLDVKKFSHLKHYTDAKGIASLKNILGDYLLVGNGLKPLIYTLQLAFSILYPNGTIVH